MRKFSFLPALIALTVMVACNSNSNQATNGTDSTGDTTTKSMDTAHGNMNMSAVEPLPDVPAGARVYFKNLKEGETVSSPVKVEMGAEGIAVDTAGTVKPASGHFHIIIDASPTPLGEVVPKDSTHLHYGNAQHEAEVPLQPGKHTLILQFADGLHRSYGDKLASTVTVNVK